MTGNDNPGTNCHDIYARPLPHGARTLRRMMKKRGLWLMLSPNRVPSLIIANDDFLSARPPPHPASPTTTANSGFERKKFCRKVGFLYTDLAPPALPRPFGVKYSDTWPGRPGTLNAPPVSGHNYYKLFNMLYLRYHNCGRTNKTGRRRLPSPGKMAHLIGFT